MTVMEAGFVSQIHNAAVNMVQYFQLHLVLDLQQGDLAG